MAKTDHKAAAKVQAQARGEQNLPALGDNSKILLRAHMERSEKRHAEIDRLKDEDKAHRREIKEQGFELGAYDLARKRRRESAEKRNLRKDQEQTCDQYMKDVSDLPLFMYEPQDFDEDEEDEDEREAA